MRNGSKPGSECVNLSLSYCLHMNSLLRRSDIAPPFHGNSLANWCLFLLYRRPGILVLINDADWELEGEEEYELKSGDNILFVSTLHGG